MECDDARDMEDDLLRVSKRRRLEHMTVASPRPRSGVNLGKPSDAVGAHARARSPALSPELAAKASALTSTRGFAKCGSPPPRRPAAGPSPPPLVEHPSGSSDDDVGLPNNKINSRPDLPFDLPASHGGASGTSVNKPNPPPAAEDDEAFARRLQEEENARYQAEREESQRRAAEWRRAHEAMMAAAEIEEDLDEDAGGIDDDDDDDDVGVDGVPGIEALGDEGLGAGGVAESDVDADAREQRRAARRALARARRAQMTELHRFMGALHNTINAAGETAADRAQLAALVMSDRDFTEDDYERLLALDNANERRGVSADALRRMPRSAWCESSNDGESSRGADNVRCAICLEDYGVGESLRHLPCLHSYHGSCVDRWFEHSVECPVCKCDVNALMNKQD